MSKVVSLNQVRKEKTEVAVFERWVSFYTEKPHEELLDALVYEHDNDFPLRRSAEVFDQLRHRALVQVLQSRAQTEFLKSFLDDLKNQSTN